LPPGVRAGAAPAAGARAAGRGRAGLTTTGESYGLYAFEQAAPAVRRHRGWLVRRALALADIAGLCFAFAIVELAIGGSGVSNRLGTMAETAVFLLLVPLWVVIEYLGGRYDRDELRANHTTVDDLV